MRLVGKIPSYSNDVLHVCEDEQQVVIQIVGERGAVHGAVRLSDWGSSQLCEHVASVMGVPKSS